MSDSRLWWGFHDEGCEGFEEEESRLGILAGGSSLWERRQHEAFQFGEREMRWLESMVVGRFGVNMASACHPEVARGARAKTNL